MASTACPRLDPGSSLGASGELVTPFSCILPPGLFRKGNLVYTCSGPGHSFWSSPPWVSGSDLIALRPKPRRALHHRGTLRLCVPLPPDSLPAPRGNPGGWAAKLGRDALSLLSLGCAAGGKGPGSPWNTAGLSPFSLPALQLCLC